MGNKFLIRIGVLGIIFVVLISGCTKNNPTSDKKTSDKKTEEQTTKTANIQVMNDTPEYKKFIAYNKQINQKLNSTVSDWDDIFSKIDSMKGLVSELKAKGYDVSVEEEYLKLQEGGFYYYKKSMEASSEVDTTDDLARKKQIIDELIESCNKHMTLFKSVDKDMRIALEQRYYITNAVQLFIDSDAELLTELEARRDAIQKELDAGKTEKEEFTPKVTCINHVCEIGVFIQNINSYNWAACTVTFNGKYIPINGENISFESGTGESFMFKVSQSKFGKMPSNYETASSINVKCDEGEWEDYF